MIGMVRIFRFVAFSLAMGTSQFSASQTPANGPRTYLGFDRNIYPGDGAMNDLRQTFSFTSYWLSPPPGEKENTWRGKRDLLRSKSFGFLVLYRGPESRELKTNLLAKQKGNADARSAIAAANREGFPPASIVFLDIEEGGRLPASYHEYLHAWTVTLNNAGYRSGVYCSGISVREEPSASITTADDIHNHASGLDVTFWVYDDACPPSPGCDPGKNPAPPSASGIPFASVWQFAQSPKRKEFTSHCPANQPGGNCYAPTDSAQKWFLDLNSAQSPDPSNASR